MHEDDNRRKVDWATALITIFVIGVYARYAIEPGVGLFDWTKEIPYFQFIRYALSVEGATPLIWWSPAPTLLQYPAIEQSRIFVANPETVLLSPFALLPLLFPEHTTPKVIGLILLIIGLTGAFFLSHQCQWNRYQRRCFFALFFLSPIILQHLAIGFTPWANLFLFPWLLFFILRKGWRADVCVGAVIALSLLQGGSHPGFWFLGFCALYYILGAMCSRSLGPLRRLFVTTLAMVALSSFRMTITSEAYQGLELLFVRGYGITEFLFWSLHLPVGSGPESNRFIAEVWNHIPSWDAGIYFGPALPLLVAMMLCYPLLHRRLASRSSIPVGRLLLCTLPLIYFSFDFHFVEFVSYLNSFGRIPFSRAIERYPFRFMIMVYFLAIICLCQIIGLLPIHRWKFRYQRLYNLVELGTAIPLAIALLTWAKIGVSADPAKYMQKVPSPQLVLEDIDSNAPASDVQVKSSAESATIEKNSPEFRRYILSQIPPRDRKMITLSLPDAADKGLSARLKTDRQNNRIILQASGTGRILLRFNYEKYLPSFFVTVCSWLALAIIGLLSLRHTLVSSRKRSEHQCTSDPQGAATSNFHLPH